MASKKPPYYERTISHKLYFEKLFIEKTNICSLIFLPILKKEVLIKFNICEIREHKKEDNKRSYGDHSVMLKEIKSGDLPMFKMDNTDLTKELKKYCPDPKDNSVYFYIEVFDQGNKLPSYYGILYLGSYFNNWKNNSKINYGQFVEEYQRAYNGLMYAGKISSSFHYHFNYYLRFLGDLINKYLDKGELSPESLEEFEKTQLNLRDPCIYYFVAEITNEFVNKTYQDKKLMRCQNSKCYRIIKYVKGKKFCSLLSEGRDCGKKARNRRYYETKGKERLSEFQRKTQELRIFYQNKNVKK